MRIGTVALVVALALSILSTPAPAQVLSGSLEIHVKAVLGEATSMGARTVIQFNGTAFLISPLIEGGESEEPGNGAYVYNTIPVTEGQTGTRGFGVDSPSLLIGNTTVVCTGIVDDAGNGSGRCASSGEFEGDGAWAGRFDIQARSLILDMHLQVVCLRCAPR